MYEHILTKKYKTYCSASPENYDINLAVKHLGFKVEGKPLDKHKGNDAKVNIAQDNSVLALAYYSNQLTTYLSLESILALSVSFLTNFDHPTELIKTTTVEEVYKLASFIQDLLKNEFLNQLQISEIGNKKEFMEDLRIFKIENG